MTQPSLFEQVVQPAIDRAEANADESWKSAAMECIAIAASTMEDFTADDILELLSNRPEKTHNLAALGPVMQKAKRIGWIANTGRMRQTRLAQRHRKLTVWQSRVFAGGAS
ncbi:MAG: hypothetical protein AAGJ40_02675 [Planctomycetota bacterium]